MQRPTPRRCLRPILPFVLVATALALIPAGPAESQENSAPGKGGLTKSLGMPPVYKGYAGFEIQWVDPGDVSDAGGLVNLGVLKDLKSPIIGIAAISVEGYAGMRAQELDGGGRAQFNIPSLYVSTGIDYNIRDEKLSFLLQLKPPGRRGGILGNGSNLTLSWLPGRGNTLALGVSFPLWGKHQGRTRPPRDNVQLTQRQPQRLELDAIDATLDELLKDLRERAHWIGRMTQPFVEHSGADPHVAMAPYISELKEHWEVTNAAFPNGHTLNEEIRIYHETLDRAFSLALGRDVQRQDSATEPGRQVCAQARDALLENVLFPYNRLLGQRKTQDSLTGMIAVAQSEFAQLLLSELEVNREGARRAFFVFQTLCDIMEENRNELRERWKDSRFVWLPLQYALQPEDHDTQGELNAIIERAVEKPFSEGTRAWFFANEEFQWEIVRSVRQAEDYHVLWIHDIRGQNGQGKPDRIAFEQVKNYLIAMTERVRAYDRSGKLPIYMIFLDQHYFELNKSRLWLRLLSKPLDHVVNLPSGYEEWETELAELQDNLRKAVAESQLLRVQTSQYGEKWLKNRIKVHVNITNPADFSFYSFHVVGIMPVPDNNMRDHRKIAFYDVTEEDPYRGMAMFTGMGIGEHYVGANWEDRAIMVQGPGALAVKDAARELLLAQGFTDEEIPEPLRPKLRGPSYQDQIEEELAPLQAWRNDRKKLLQLHNQTGFMPKRINPAKAVLYSLMPPGSVLKVPDSLWQSYSYASLLAGSALRGCRVLVIAPTKDSAPSAGSPQLTRAHGMLGRLIVFKNQMSGALDSSGGLLEVGLYAPKQGVGDIAGRMKQAAEAVPSWIAKVYPPNPELDNAALNAGSLLDSLGYQVHYLAEDSVAIQPKMHLKANFFASGPGWDKLAARPEWGGVLREYIIYLAGTATPVEESDGMPDVKAYPAEFKARASELITNFYADLSAEEREAIVYFLTVGSVNMDYRSQCLDGEAMILLSSWQSLNGMIDFMLLAGMCQWLDTTEQLDALLPPSGGMTRSISGLMKIML